MADSILRVISLSILLFLVGCTAPACRSVLMHAPPPLSAPQAVDRYVERLRVREHVPGLALAIIDHGRISYVHAYGDRRLRPEARLNEDTVMYGASLTKFVFTTYVMRLVEDGRLELDRPIAAYFPKALPQYEEYVDLAGDDRWRQLTLRMLLDHTPGFANFRFFPPRGGFDPDGKLKFYFDPGTRYAYSGEGYILAQRVLELGLGIDLADDMRRRLFAPLGMERTGMIWHDTFAPNYAVGYDADGKALGHNLQDNVRAAGSMDTTIRDFAHFVAAFLRGNVVSQASRRVMLAPQIAITSRHQFPSLDTIDDPRNRDVDLSAGLGVVLWHSPFGPAFIKGGHDEKTDNLMVCLQGPERCVILLSNTPKGDRLFPEIVRFILGDIRFPWRWEYSSRDEGR